MNIRFIKYSPLFLVLSLVIGCKQTDNRTSTYFGGKIINPKANNVILYTIDNAIDTIFLNENNTFSSSLDSINAGLYYFKHGNEHQFIYLEPNDSLLLRLNTWDFDESLVFSGTGAFRNNELLDVFLQNEVDEKNYSTYFNLNPATFKTKIDSILFLKNKRVEDFSIAHPDESDKFLEILTIANTYPTFKAKEDYLIKNYDSLKNSKSLPWFTNHRDKIDLKLDNIFFYSLYNNYIITRNYADTYIEGHQNNTDEFAISLLKNIGKNIETENLKNKLLRHSFVSNYFFKKCNGDINSKAFLTFFELSTSIEDKIRIQQLLNDAKSLQKEKTLPNFDIIDAKGSLQKVNTIIKGKNTLLYFKNNNKNYNWISSRIHFLQNKYPDVQFLIVDIKDSISTIKNLAIKNQYYLPEKSIANNFLTSNYPRAILVSNKGVVYNSYANISSRKIENQITELEKN